MLLSISTELQAFKFAHFYWDPVRVKLWQVSLHWNGEARPLKWWWTTWMGWPSDSTKEKPKYINQIETGTLWFPPQNAKQQVLKIQTEDIYTAPLPLKEGLIIESFPKCKFPSVLQIITIGVSASPIPDRLLSFPPWKIKCYGFNSRVQWQSQGKWGQPGVFHQIEVLIWNLG